MIRLCSILTAGLLLWTSALMAGGDEEAIERVLLAEAKSSATFVESRDKQAVLKLYTSDYSGVEDGEAESRDSIERWLSEYGSALEQGSRVHFLGAVSNLNTHISGSTAWSTYDYVFQAIKNGEFDAQDQGKCTSILRKESAGWLIRHQHCSKTKPQGMER
ncbi:MAG TPA: nuclear transport factor 2 family protein [Nitrospira sp.]|nr:nuclear transport factor 2 family protein [Nitrospira sp.]